ncbi:uncharacterized protein LOC121272316 [Carcharodon carcharias]|uniref:uncharacterized protein LOC121272316 n=1 Tax=Carcharodon carcharias TaxID=13397 RepID=UPI001B7DAB30|nr:uncharacterized protein LOC121272316 [Carcharodon carcharias]XP_041034856.1 uncharacterized protein LOC121272316 [Carcharodon carcharias]XP_041034858.1 uncharacterized protein LOC121272316 [Carcharodon carcharias]
MEIVKLGLVLMLFTGMTGAARLTCGERQVRIKARSGDAIDLPCLFTWHGGAPGEHMVVWQLRGGEQDSLVYGRESHLENPERGPRFGNRTELERGWFAEGDATLSLSSLVLSDGGLYTCQVTTMNPHRRKVCAEVTLTIQKGPGTGNHTGDPSVSQQHHRQGNSTTERLELAAERDPHHVKLHGAWNGSSRNRAPIPLLFSQVLILLFLVLQVC